MNWSQEQTPKHLLRVWKLELLEMGHTGVVPPLKPRHILGHSVLLHLWFALFVQVVHFMTRVF